MSRELDVRVAKELGESVCECKDDAPADMRLDGQWACVRCGRALPKHRSTNIATAWPLFEQLGPAWCIAQSDAMGWRDDCRWWCFLPVEYGGDGTEYMAATPAAAICKAFLAWKEADRD